MQSTSLAFKDNARRSMADPALQRALALAKPGFQLKRAAAASRLPEFEALRDQAKAIKDHTLDHLDLYLGLDNGGKYRPKTSQRMFIRRDQTRSLVPAHELAE